MRFVITQGKANVVADALSRKERVKPRRVRAMSMTIRSSVKDKILTAQSEASKVENEPTEMLCGLDQQMKKNEDDGLYFMNQIWVLLVGSVRTLIMDEARALRYSVYPGADKTYYDLRDMYWVGRKEFRMRYNSLYVAEGIRNTARYETDGQTTEVVLIKERLKAARDFQKRYADNRRKPLEVEVGDQLLLKVSPWKGVVHFGKKDKLAPRYVGSFEILKRIGPIAYRLRLPQELSSVDNTLCFVEEPVEVMDREVKRLKRSKILIVKVHWNSKRGYEFTWEREDYIKVKYPHLFVEQVMDGSTS
ncbi:hypothetical protein Tco_0863061 [Tanacetum coccineum]